MEQLIISDDHKSVIYKGTTSYFKEVAKVKKNTCRYCWLDRAGEDVCRLVPCTAVTNISGKDGVYTIQEMPTIKSKIR